MTFDQMQKTIALVQEHEMKEEKVKQSKALKQRYDSTSCAFDINLLSCKSIGFFAY